MEATWIKNNNGAFTKVLGEAHVRKKTKDKCLFCDLLHLLYNSAFPRFTSTFGKIKTEMKNEV